MKTITHSPTQHTNLNQSLISKLEKGLIAFLFFFFLSSVSYAIDGKPNINKAKEILPNRIVESKVVGNQRIDKQTNKPLVIYSPNYAVNAAEPVAMARQYLSENSSILQLKSDLSELMFVRTIETPGGFKSQFVQMAEGYPVYGSTVKVSINRNNKVVFVTNSSFNLGNIETSINIDANAAVQLSKNYLNISGNLVSEKIETVVYNINRSKSVLAYKINLIPAENNFGDWELIIDATSGSILRAEDKACYSIPLADTVNGSAWVFDPDPITNAKTVYGASGFTDNSDFPTDSVAAQVKTVELRDISFDGSMYKLDGPYAVIVDVEAPFTGLHEQDSANFHHPRNERAFEAAQIYYHVEHSMRYVNDSLGFDVMPFQYSGGVKFDPHGLNGALNAWYTSAGYIAFGSPSSAVDLGEDNAVILHELGHGLHDWITNGQLSQVDGLSEGNSDYWAQSYTRSLGILQPEDDGYDWFGVWGGMPGFSVPSLRVTNYNAHYPEDLTGVIHTDGQMWSSSLMSIYDEIGRYATDMNCWEAISMLDGNSSQLDAANAFIQADNDLNNGANLMHIVPVFVERGYLEDLVYVEFIAENQSGVGPLEVNFTDQSVTYLYPIESWEWDFNDDGIVDSDEQNPSYTYTESGFYTVRLTVFDGDSYYDLVKTDFVSVNEGFYVYEVESDQYDYSGTYIKNFLEAQGYDVMYSPFIPSSFDGFDAVFLTMGNGSANRTILDNDLAQTVREYLEDGGNIYLEGGDALGFDQAGNAPLRLLFGLQASSNGTENLVENLSGHSDAITDGMLFNGSNQINNNSIDIFTPNQTEGSKAALTESEYGIVAVQNAGADFNNHTFCFSYALAELEDSNPESSRYNLLVRIMEFFGYPFEDGYVVSNFSADIQEGLPALEVMFSDWSLNDDGTEVNSWAWDFDGDGFIDSDDQNPIWTYDLGGIFDVMLIVSNGQDTDTLIKKDFIIVRSGIFVYEQKQDEPGYSGAFIRNYLEDNNYDEVSYSNRFPDELAGYDAVFLSFGNAGDKRTPFTNEIRGVVNTYGQEGGRIYLEGGDVLGFDLAEDYPFWLVFGLSDVDNGENNSIEDLQGQDDAITNGMMFTGSTQAYVNSIDIYQTFVGLDDARVAFSESDYGPVAVQFSGEQVFGQRTFCFSYALAELEDGDGVNTRNELLYRILNFFDITVGVEEKPIDKMLSELKVYPNPVTDRLTLEFSLEQSQTAIIEIFDLSGRKIYGSGEHFNAGTHLIDYDVKGYPSGLNYIRVQAGEKVETIKWIKVD